MERVGLEWWGWVGHGREENQLHHTFQKENAKEEGSVPELDVAMQPSTIPDADRGSDSKSL